MTKRIPIVGGVFGDCSPEGDWVCSVIGQAAMMKSWEPVSIPAPAEMMCNRLYGRKIASKTASPGHVMIHDGAWFDFIKIVGGFQTTVDSPGVYGHGWDDQGVLHVLTAGEHQESMGLQFYDPSITSPHASLDRFRTTPGFVTGSPAYTPDTPLAHELGVKRLYSWTKRGDVVVGQGDSGGTAIQYQGKHYLLEHHDSRFVQFHRAGDQLAIAITRLAQGDVIFHWLTVSEITSLPRYGDPQPDPIEPPPPDPEEPMDILRDRTQLVREVRRRVTGKGDDEKISEHQALNVIRALLQEPEMRRENWGMVRAKAGSTNNVDGYTNDVIAQRDGEHVDVFGSGEAGAFPAWQPVRYKEGWNQSWNDAIAKRWEAAGDAPVEPGPDPEPEPDKPPTGKIKRGTPHVYWRPDKDRNECSVDCTDGRQCDEEEEDPVHIKTPKPEPEPEPEPEPPALPKHAFKGLLARCTYPKCGRPKTDPIHSTVTPEEPKPANDYEKKSLANQAEIIRLLKLAVGE